MKYIIVFWDSTKLQVTEEVGLKLKTAIREETIKTFELGDSLYSIKGVNKIIPKEEAYKAYPLEWEVLNNLETILPKNSFLKLGNGNEITAIQI